MLEGSAAAPADQAHLGMDLVVLKAVHDITAGFHQFLGIVDIVLLVKAGLQFDQHGHFLAVFRGQAEIVHQPGAFGQAVNRDADGYDCRIGSGFPDQLQERIHGFVRIGKQDILLLHLGKQRLLIAEGRAELGHIGRVEQPFFLRRIIDQGVHAEEPAPVQRQIRDDGRAVDGFVAALKVAAGLQAGPAGGFDLDQVHVLPLFQHLHHSYPVVFQIRQLAADIDSRIAADGELEAFQDAGAPEQGFHMGTDNIFHMDEPDSLLARQTDKRVQESRNRGQGQDGAVPIIHQGCRIDNAGLQLGQRMPGIDDLGAQDRLHRGQEVLLQPVFFFPGALVITEFDEAFAAHFLLQIFIDFIPLAAELGRGRKDFLELPGTAEAALVVDLVFLEGFHADQGTDPD